MTDPISQQDDGDADGLPTPRRYWAIATILLSIMMSVLDVSIANIALPTIAIDLEIDAAASVWIVSAYQITVVMALLPFASLGEIVGYRRISQVGLVVFTVASLGCTLSSSLEQLIAFRVLQGLGAAGINSVNGALVRFTYPHRLLGPAIGLNAFVVSISAALGPTAAAGLLSLGDWRLLFAINVPLGCIVIFLAAFSLPASPRAKRRPNYVGAALSAAMFGLLITGVQAIAHRGSQIIGAIEVSLAAVAAMLLYRRERWRPHPLIPFDLFEKRIFLLSAVTSVTSFAAQMLALVCLPFALHEMGYSAVEIGLLITPWPLAIALSAPIAGHLADRHPAGLLGGAGLMVTAAGLAALALLPSDPSVPDIAWRMVLCGLGFGFFQSPNNRAMLASVPRERSGSASGVLGTCRVLGQSMGAAIAALLFGFTGSSAPVFALSGAALLAAAAAAFSFMRTKDETG